MENLNQVSGGGSGSAAGGHMALDRNNLTSLTESMGHCGSGRVERLRIIDFGLAQELGKLSKHIGTMRKV